MLVELRRSLTLHAAAPSLDLILDCADEVRSLNDLRELCDGMSNGQIEYRPLQIGSMDGYFRVFGAAFHFLSYECVLPQLGEELDNSER